MIWSGHAPVLFPICGELKDNKFVYKDTEYTLPRHGFARRREFDVEQVNKNLKSRKVILKNNTTGYSIIIEFPGKEYFLLWTNPGAAYICLEPWCGIADDADSDYDITKKKGINALSGNNNFIKEHTITF